MNYLQTSKMSLVLLAACLFSCEIKDDRGTVLSDQGEFIGEFTPLYNVLYNESRQEIYFVDHESYEYITLLSLNYETKEVSTLFKINRNSSDLRLIRKQEVEKRLLFITWDYSANTQITMLHEIDLETLEHNQVLTHALDEYRISANQDYLFFNYEYINNYILKSDFEGNMELLDIQGEVVYAIPGTNQIILQNNINTGQEHLIYDYDLDNIVLTKAIGYYYPDRFYTYSDQIFYSDYQRVVNFKTDHVLYYTGAFNQMFLDFNPVSNKVVFNKFDEGDLYSPRLILRDLNDDDSDFSLLHGRHIAYAKILNDGKTVIYYDGQGFYKISTE